MSRQKNALTKHFVAPTPADGSEPAYERLAKWISTINDDSNEETEETGYYDGDGTPETDVISIAKTWSFEGFYDSEDPGQKFIASLEFDTGDARKIMYKQERTDGSVLEGPATVSGIVATGGDATAYATFNCTIAWDKKPTITPPAP